MRKGFRCTCGRALAITAAIVANLYAGASMATDAAEPAASLQAGQVVPVVVDGRTLMDLRGISALSATRRASDVASRIEAAAADPAIAPDDLTVADLPDRTSIMAGSRLMLSVVDADARAEGLADRRLLASAYRDAIAEAIARYREERTTRFLARQGIAALVALALAAVLLFALRAAARRLVAAARGRDGGRMEAVEARSFSLLTVEQIEGVVEGLINGVRWMLAFVIVAACAEYILSLFPWTRLAAVRATALLVDPLRIMGDAILRAVPGLVFIAILVVVTRYALKLLQLFFSGIANERIRLKGFAREWAWPTYRLVRIAVVAFAVVIAYPYIPGSSSDAFKGVSIFAGLLMSLGAASAVANSLAGYTLIYRRTFKLGDRIRVGEVVGDVVEMRQQVTLLRSIDNEVITIPSSTMLTSQVTNYSSLATTKGLILHTRIGIGYETPWRQVEAMLLLAASRTPGLEREPSPFVLVKALGDFAIEYEVKAYCRDPQAMEATYATLHRSVLDVFNEFGVAIMTPAYQDDPEIPKVVARDQWFRAPAAAPPSTAAGKSPRNGE